MCVVIAYGDEPYRIDLLKENLKSAITNKTLNLSLFSGDFTSEVATQCNSYPFMDKMRGVILDADSLKSLDNSVFLQYVKEPSKTCHLLVVLKDGKVDKRLKIYKKLQTLGLFRECNRYHTDSELRQVINQELKSFGASIDDDALSEFLDRTSYLDVASVSMLDLIGQLKSIAVINNHIDIGMVRRYIPSNQQGNVFLISRYIEKKDIDSLKKEVGLVAPDSQSVLGCLGALMRDLRIAYKRCYFESEDISAFRVPREGYCFCNVPAVNILDAMHVVTEAMASVKKGAVPSVALADCAGRVYRLM